MDSITAPTIDNDTLKNNDAVLLYNELVLIHNEIIILFQDLMQSYKSIINNNNFMTFKQYDAEQLMLEHGPDLSNEELINDLILNYMRKVNNKNVEWYVKVCNEFDAICGNKFMTMYNIFEFVNKKYGGILSEIDKLKQKVNKQEKHLGKIMNIYDELDVKDEYVKFSHAFNHLKMKIVVNSAYVEALVEEKIYTF